MLRTKSLNQYKNSTLIQRIPNLVNQERITEISEIRDESDREGIRVVIMLKRSANPGVVLNQLYKYTQMQQTIGVINLALVKGRPKVMGLKELIRQFVAQRIEVSIRSTHYGYYNDAPRDNFTPGLTGPT